MVVDLESGLNQWSLYLIDSSGISKKSFDNGTLHHNFDQSISFKNSKISNLIFWNENLAQVETSSSHPAGTSLAYSAPLSCPYSSCSQCYASHDVDCVFKDSLGCVKSDSSAMTSNGYDSCVIDVNVEREVLNRNTPTVLIANLSHIQHYTGYNWKYNGKLIANDDCRFSQTENIGNGRLSLIVYQHCDPDSTRLVGNYSLSVVQNENIIFKKNISVYEESNQEDEVEAETIETTEQAEMGNATHSPDDLIGDQAMYAAGDLPNYAILFTVGVGVLIICVLVIIFCRKRADRSNEKEKCVKKIPETTGSSGNNQTSVEVLTPMLSNLHADSEDQIIDKPVEPNGENKSIYLSCRSYPESPEISKNAVIVFPDGSIKRINHKKLGDLKVSTHYMYTTCMLHRLRITYM